MELSPRRLGMRLWERVQGTESQVTGNETMGEGARN